MCASSRVSGFPPSGRAAFARAGEKCGQCGGEHPARFHTLAALWKQLCAAKRNRGATDTARNKAQGEVSGENACHLYALSGNCKYGDRCKFSHDKAACEAWKAKNYPS